MIIIFKVLLTDLYVVWYQEKFNMSWIMRTIIAQRCVNMPGA
jgi:hypothetical protein